MCEHDKAESGCCCGNGHVDGGAGSRAACHCGGNIPRHFILPAILLLLDEEPSHGYSLFHKLSGLGITDAAMSPATVYRVLSKLEEEGLAVHEHADDGQGPTRKVYMLTDEGREALAGWRSHIEETRGLLDWFAKRASSK
jgi:DNA-binding PadR family transcriptional regulator